MPSAPKNESYEERRNRYLRAGYKIATTRKQNRDEDGSLKVTDEELWVQAARYADRKLEQAEKASSKAAIVQTELNQDDEDYRRERLSRYRKDYDWNDSNDAASLGHMLDLEVQIRQINRELSEGSKSTIEKDKLRKNLEGAIKERRLLEQALGIDRISREKKASGGDPMTDWERIKEEAAIKKQQQRDEFLEWAEKVQTEAELRDRIKVGLLVKFDVVDAMLSAHRRILGLPPIVEKS